MENNNDYSNRNFLSLDDNMQVLKENQTEINNKYSELRRTKFQVVAEPKQLKVIDNNIQKKEIKKTKKKLIKKRKLDKKKLVALLIATTTIVGVSSVVVHNYNNYKEEQVIKDMLYDYSCEDAYNEATKDIREELSKVVSDATEYGRSIIDDDTKVDYKMIADYINNSTDPKRCTDIFIVENHNGPKGIISGVINCVNEPVIEHKNIFGMELSPPEKLAKYLNATVIDQPYSGYLYDETVKYSEKVVEKIALESTKEGKKK